LFVAEIQKSRSKNKTRLLQIADLTGTHMFLVSLFPFIYCALGYAMFSRQLLILNSLGIYVGNWLKDYLCLPRPMPPAERLSSVGNNEFGLPSTHSVTAFTIPFFSLFYILPKDSWLFFFGFILAVIYTFIVSYSRLYLGMHCVADLLGGIIIAAVLLFIWFGAGLGIALEHWLITGSMVEFTAVAIGVFLMFLHPEPVDYCPCFEDSACFIGAASGIIIGHFRAPNIFKGFQNFSFLACSIRFIVGLSLLLVTRYALKKLMVLILPWFFETFHPPSRQFLDHFTDKSKPRIKGVPSMVDMQSKTQSKSALYDIDIPSKFIVYCALAWLTTEFTPKLFYIIHLC